MVKLASDEPNMCRLVFRMQSKNAVLEWIDSLRLAAELKQVDPNMRVKADSVRLAPIIFWVI